MVGVSQAFVSLVERGRRRADLRTACALASATGHELSVKLFPVTTPSLRDSGQLELVDAIVGRAHTSWRIRVEEPVGPGDRRAADLVLVGPDEVVHIEVERWLVDFQAQFRSAVSKRQVLAQHLGNPVRLVIAAPASRRVRKLVGGLQPVISASLPLRSAEVMRAIDNGTVLGADGLLLLAPRRLPTSKRRI